MNKIDFKKTDKYMYTGKVGQFDIVSIPSIPYLMIDGIGDPNNSTEYAHAITALYGLSYGLKFYSKKELGKDYVVPPLEGVWWADNMEIFKTGLRDQWQWTMMIRQPNWIMDAMLAIICEATIAKNAKKKIPPTTAKSFRQVRLEQFTEGRCVQILHIGSYADEGPVIKEMHTKFILQNGLVMTGKHHEIYLNDPRKVRPEKLKTILRQPVK